MRIALFVLVGAAVGAIFYHIPRWADDYSQHGLPTEWQGPKYRHWKNGVEQK